MLSSLLLSELHKATENKDDQRWRTLGKIHVEGNVDSRLQLEEDRDGRARESWMETSGLWPRPMLHCMELQGIYCRHKSSIVSECISASAMYLRWEKSTEEFRPNF